MNFTHSRRPLRLLVLGGAGFLGRHLISALQDSAGPDVQIAVVGRTQRAVPDGVTFLRGDRRKPAFLRMLAKMQFDGWLDLALYTRAEAEQLVELFQEHGCPRFLFVAGSIAEYGLHLDLPMPIAADSPLRGEGPYDKGKIEAWQVLSRGIGSCDCRLLWGVLPQLWGPHDPHGRDSFFAQQIVQGKPIPLPGNGRTVMPDGYAGTVAQAIAHLALHTDFEGRTNVAGLQLVTPLQFISNSARALGCTARVLHLTPKQVQACEREHGFRFRSPFSNADLVLDLKSLRDSGFEPETDVREGIALTAKWHRDQASSVSDAVTRSSGHLCSVAGVVREVPIVD